MLGYRLEPRNGVVILTPRGRLDASDFASLALTVDPWIEDHGKLRGILIDARSLPRWDDVDAMLAQLRFVRNHHRAVERVAVVTDLPLLEALPAIARLFTGADVRRFAHRERRAAVAWLGRISQP